MTPERWRQITGVFHAARHRDPGLRKAFLDEACGADATLRAEVEAMLGADAEPTEAGGIVAKALDDAWPRLESGTLIGSYRIEGLIGAGGMGEVYRARDLRLGRDVAVKVLSHAFVVDPARRARLEHEARLLAALDHPRIAAIYELEQVDDTPALVLELIEGATLAERLEHGPIPIRESLALAAQVAEALEAAHARGIVHRDLKPANIKIGRDGTAKVLDFGLAKVTSDSSPGLTHARLATADRTREGTVMGTAGYMSPEQARGQPVDKATDVWAFGCVLYEMLTGRRAFLAATPTDTLAAVLAGQPDWRALPGRTPLHVRTLLHRCLEKDPTRRPPYLATARRICDRGVAQGLSPDWIVGLLREWLAWKRGVPAAAGAIAILAASLAYWRFDPDAAPPRLVNPRQVTVATGVEDHPTWSPDERWVAYESNQTGNWDIWATAMAGGAPVNRTADHPGDDRYPSWSADGRHVAFWSDRDGGGYFVMPVTGGAPKKVASAAGTSVMHHGPPTWSADGRLFHVGFRAVGAALEPGLEVVAIDGGEAQRFRLPGREETRLEPRLSPDGRYLAYADAGSGSAETTQLLLLRLADGHVVEVTDARAHVRSPIWSRDGRALYYVSNRDGPADLWRQRVDDGGGLQGLAQRVSTGLEMQHARFSPDGRRIVYSRGRWVSNVWRVPVLADRRVTWADAEQVTFEQAFIEAMDVSPDGRTLAFASDRTGNQDLWTMPVTGEEATRLTDDPAPDWNPTFSPDGGMLAFYSHRTGDRELWVVPARGGRPRQLTRSPGLDAGVDWSPDGREIAFRSERSGSSDIWVISSDGERVRQITAGPDIDYFSHWSPDGRWVAYTSNRDGKRRIWRVPREGGQPERLTRAEAWDFTWSADGTAIHFVGGGEQSGNLWSVALETGQERPLTDLRGRRGTLGTFAVTTDGRYLYFTWRDDVGDLWVMDVVAP